MSNARILADLMGTSTTVPSSKLSLAATDLPSGTVLQVVQGELGSTVTKAPAIGNVLDSGLEATITPSSTSSKILVQYSIYLGQIVSYNAWTRILRGSTEIGNATAEGTHRPVGNACVTTFGNSADDGYSIMYAGNSFLDETISTTSATTYKIQIGSYAGGNVYVNRSNNFEDNANGYDTIPLSTITLTEISG
jgi:hypothetical protein